MPLSLRTRCATPPSTPTPTPDQVWDKRATGPNEALAECVLQLATLHGKPRDLNLVRVRPYPEL